MRRGSLRWASGRCSRWPSARTPPGRNNWPTPGAGRSRPPTGAPSSRVPTSTSSTSARRPISMPTWPSPQPRQASTSSWRSRSPCRSSRHSGWWRRRSRRVLCIMSTITTAVPRPCGWPSGSSTTASSAASSTGAAHTCRTGSLTPPSP